LTQHWRERFALAYLDPPFNTGADKGYPDRLPHGVWLAFLDERLPSCNHCFRPGAVVVIHLDISELHYLKVLCDERFGRERFLGQVSWRRSPDRTVLGQGSALLSDHLEYLLVYAHQRKPIVPRPTRTAPIPPQTLATYSRQLTIGAARRPTDEFVDGQGQTVRIFVRPDFTLARSVVRT